MVIEVTRTVIVMRTSCIQTGGVTDSKVLWDNKMVIYFPCNYTKYQQAKGFQIRFNFIFYLDGVPCLYFLGGGGCCLFGGRAFYLK